MSNSTLGSWSTLNASGEDIEVQNGTGLPNSHDSRYIFSWYPVTEIIISAFIFIISIFGLMGNGSVIWFLGFCMKRNPFTTFILNLAAADLGTLICLFTFSIIDLLDSFLLLPSFDYLLFITFGMFPLLFMYNTGQYLLTAISIDRCVSVLFPLWHRCHRPPHFPTLVCATIWIISFLLNLSLSLTDIVWPTFFYLLLMNAILCLPLMTVSTLVIFIKVYFRSHQRKKGKAVTAILLALLFFLFLAFPFTCILLINFTRIYINDIEIFLGLLCSCLNSSVNPLIYFLVGRKKHSQSRESLKVIFQRVFKEEEHGREEVELRVSLQV